MDERQQESLILLAPGILARTTGTREAVIGEIHHERDNLSPVKVMAFNGLQDPDYRLWGDFVEQLANSDVFDKFY